MLLLRREHLKDGSVDALRKKLGKGSPSVCSSGVTPFAII